MCVGLVTHIFEKLFIMYIERIKWLNNKETTNELDHFLTLTFSKRYLRNTIEEPVNYRLQDKRIKTAMNEILTPGS